MSFTPRRSTRGAIFTPSPFPSPTLQPANEASTSYHWISSASHPLGPEKPHYNAFKRLVNHAATPGRRKGKAKSGIEDTRFAVGDGVSVSVEGGNEGVGIITRMWEEDDEEEEDDEKEEVDDLDSMGDEASVPGKGRRKMADVHWCFRRQDLPGIMKNLSVADNEVLLAASPIRPVTTSLPIHLLIKTIPIYSRTFFKSQFEPKQSVVKGWTYIRQGVYWCERAFDKGAKGGKVWRVDVDEWREGGKRGEGWIVPTRDLPEPAQEDSGDEEGASEGSEAGAGLEEGSGSEDEGAAEQEGKDKHKRRGAAKKPERPAKRARKSASRPEGPKPKRGRKAPHPATSASQIPSSIPSLESLPADPYQRALRLLHVGATPESLPCREEEFVDVLSKVEEGVESGGGGCLYIAGVPGTGKTATVHAVVKELKRKAEDGELPPFSYVEINGLKIPSPQHAYTVLWEAISGARGASSKTALRGLEAHFGRKTGGGARGPRGHTFVVLMDELDQLLTAKQDVVYNFFNWPTMRDSQIFVIAVANRMDLPQHLAAKIKSRLGLQTLLFQPYDRQNLIEIVQSRLIAHPKSQEDHKVLQADAIALAATKMAGTNGDARRVLDACRRAVEVAIEKNPTPHPVTAKEMMTVLNRMSSSPVAMFVKSCSEQQKMMLASVIRCVRREGIPEISWRAVRSDHDNLTRSLLESNDLLSPSELLLVFTSLLASHALTSALDAKVGLDERRVALGMEIGEVGRVLMGEGDSWRRVLAGV